MSFIIGANSAVAGGFGVTNSCRLDNPGDGASSPDYLTRTPSGATNQKTFTISFWIKRWGLQIGSSQQQVIGQQASNYFRCMFCHTAGDIIRMYGPSLDLQTTAIYRDPSAWYHVCLAMDTTQAVEANRAKLYVNGTQVTSFVTETIPGQNVDQDWNVAAAIVIGRSGSSGNDGSPSYLSQFVNIDGAALAPTSFGEFDEDSGVWKPIDVSGLTFGTNGFFLDFADAADLGDDESGNGNDFVESGIAAANQATDTPTNNFATLNSIEEDTGKTFTIGNCKQFLTGVSSFTRSTIGAASGKWYCEVKLIAGIRAMYGISSYGSSENSGANYLGAVGSTAVGYSYGVIGNTGRLYHAGSSTASWVSTFGHGDIIMLAMDLDNNKLYFGKNGTWERSGDPTSGATGTGAYTIVAPSLNGNGFYQFAFGCNSTGEDNNSEMNFGNPAFTVSSGNADGDGYGNFEYAVPSDYFALCTKNLATYG